MEIAIFENPQILIFVSKFQFFFDQNVDFVLGISTKGRFSNFQKFGRAIHEATIPGRITPRRVDRAFHDSRGGQVTEIVQQQINRVDFFYQQLLATRSAFAKTLPKTPKPELHRRVGRRIFLLSLWFDSWKKLAEMSGQQASLARWNLFEDAGKSNVTFRTPEDLFDQATKEQAVADQTFAEVSRHIKIINASKFIQGRNPNPVQLRDALEFDDVLLKAGRRLTAELNAILSPETKINVIWEITDALAQAFNTLTRKAVSNKTSQLLWILVLSRCSSSSISELHLFANIAYLEKFYKGQNSNACLVTNLKTAASSLKDYDFSADSAKFARSQPQWHVRKHVTGQLVKISNLQSPYAQFNGLHGVLLSKCSAQNVPTGLKRQCGSSGSLVEFPGVCKRNEQNAKNVIGESAQWVVVPIPSRNLTSVATVSSVKSTFIGNDFQSVEYTDSSNSSKKYKLTNELNVVFEFTRV